jgi:hypothetical protein
VPKYTAMKVYIVGADVKGNAFALPSFLLGLETKLMLDKKRYYMLV